MYHFNYQLALYRRNNFGQPCVWYVEKFDDDCIKVYHGIVGKTITNDFITTTRDVNAEVKSRITAKRKAGYKLLSELKDNGNLPVEGELLSYLTAYLPDDRTTIDGLLLPMKAKVYDNTNNKLYKKNTTYMGQWKINGLRCFVSAELNDNMFKPIKLRFQSCEGTVWNSLSYLEDYLLHVLGSDLLNKMVEEHYILDGEVYLPGHTVNEINHFVKDPKCEENKLLQYWCYDIAIEDTIQYVRMDILNKSCNRHIKIGIDKSEHLNNKERFIVLPYYEISSDSEALNARDKFIDWGFEGLILRNPDAEYQYGKRNLAMIKYKRSTDGKFIIVNIKPEGIKRPDIPLFECKNDINDAIFECHVGGSELYQKSILANKNKYIGKYMYVEYGERSGVNEVPFHIKETYIIE